MKKIQNIGMIAALVPVLLFASCSNDYLDRTPSTALDTEVVLNNPETVPSTVVGTMRMMYSAGFGGRNATVIGDLMTDLVTTATRGSNGTLQDMEKWNIHAATSDVIGFWSGPYSIAAAAARTINAAHRLLADSANMTDATIKSLYNAIAASLTQKVYAEYFLTQYFCVDVNVPGNPYKLNKDAAYTKPGNNPDMVGIILMDGKALGNAEPANMSTLKATYEFLEKEAQQAIDYFQKSGSSTFIGAPTAQYYPTECAAHLLKARIYLAQHKYAAARQAAEDALNALPAGTSGDLISDPEALLAAYGASASSEDIWTLNYTSQDNLSANSLANLFGSYGANASDYAIGLFKNSDIRKNLYIKGSESAGGRPYCLKYPNDNGVFNVPMLRVPEIYLIQAEAYAYENNLPEAKAALLKVIGVRDTNVGTDMSKLESTYNVTADGIFQTILDENAREFLCEGHRWFDLRRFGKRLTRDGNQDSPKYQIHFKNYPLSTFALPVPYAETSTDQWQNGRGIKYDGTKAATNWQNNAWDKLDGNQYSATVSLPTEGTDFRDRNN